MKGKMKKLVALALAAIMVLAMGITASAANQEISMGKGPASITITNPKLGKTYTIYKVFNATETGSLEDDDLVIAYTLISGTKNELPQSTGFVADDYGNVEAVDENQTELTTSQRDALETYAEVYGQQVGSAITSTGDKLVITGLSHGYYLVKSSAGAFVSINSTTPNMVIQDKNPSAPSNPHKLVEGDQVMVGEEVEYTVRFATTNYETVSEVKTDGTVDTIIKKIEQYTITDTLPSFLSNTTITSVKVYENADLAQDGTLTPSISNDDVHSLTGYSKFDAVTKSITIPWVSTDTEKTHLYKDGAILEVVYTAVVNENVTVGAENENTVTITWNGSNTSLTDTENVYSASIVINKYDDDGPASGEGTIKLPGVTFMVLDTAVPATGVVPGDAQYLTKVTVPADPTKGIAEAYEKWDWTKDADDAEVFTTDANGAINISGLKPGEKYYLLEKDALPGYNKKLDTIEITLPVYDENSTEEGRVELGDLAYPADIANGTGSLLPSTGGIGTTIFYVVGGLLVAGAGILLITKKRMRKEQ